MRDNDGGNLIGFGAGSSVVNEFLFHDLIRIVQDTLLEVVN